MIRVRNPCRLDSRSVERLVTVERLSCAQRSFPVPIVQAKCQVGSSRHRLIQLLRCLCRIPTLRPDLDEILKGER